MFKFIRPEQITEYIKDGDTVAINAFLALANPDKLQDAMADSFIKTGHPNNLELFTPSGCGCWDPDRIIDRCAGLGMIKRVVAGHYGSMPKISELVKKGEIEAYNIPLGILCQTLRSAGSGGPFILSKIGLDLFVDPRKGGPAMNEISKRELVHYVNVLGQEFLCYEIPKIDVALIKGTSVDPEGNIVFDNEFLSVNAINTAQAAKANGGKVIVQVDFATDKFSRPRNVVIPGVLVDAVLVADGELDDIYKDDFIAMSGAVHVPPSHMDYWMGRLEASTSKKKGKADVSRWVIGDRGAQELERGQIINLGVGIPEQVGRCAAERGMLADLTMTVESGGLGGLPAPGLAFGAVIGADFICDTVQQFDFYHGGGLDICFMGGLEVDKDGNVNAHVLNGKYFGIGGFADITQSTRKICFCLNFTAGGLSTEWTDGAIGEDGKKGPGKLTILQEGREPKFRESIESISFSATNAVRNGQEVIYITERCVFRLTAEGLELVEVTPGIDKQTQVLDLLPFPVKDGTC
ncbi:MAG: propionate CoA-transferase [Firmicutes bacterium]|nr:propionate CoA-transferase [Bacillota bacterium]